MDWIEEVADVFSDDNCTFSSEVASCIKSLVGCIEHARANTWEKATEIHESKSCNYDLISDLTILSKRMHELISRANDACQIIDMRNAQENKIVTPTDINRNDFCVISECGDAVKKGSKYCLAHACMIPSCTEKGGYAGSRFCQFHYMEENYKLK